MKSITLNKSEYLKLKRRAKAFEQLAGTMFESILYDSVEEVVSDFRNTGVYTKAFLNDLEDGLRKSSYTRQKNAN